MYQETCTYWKTGGEESAKGIELIQLCQSNLNSRRYQRITLNFVQGIACCNTSALLPGNCRKVIISSKPFVGGGQTTLDGHLGKRPHSHHFSPAVVFVYLHLRKSDKD